MRDNEFAVGDYLEHTPNGGYSYRATIYKVCAVTDALSLSCREVRNGVVRDEHKALVIRHSKYGGYARAYKLSPRAVAQLAIDEKWAKLKLVAQRESRYPSQPTGALRIRDVEGGYNAATIGQLRAELEAAEDLLREQEAAAFAEEKARTAAQSAKLETT